MNHNSDMINLVKLMEGKNQFAGEEVGQKPGDQVRGTDQAEVDGTEHPFKGRLVGEDTTLEDVLSKKYQDFKDVQAKEKEEKQKEKLEDEKEEIDEVSLGDYMTKAKKSRALSQMSAAFANDPAERERHAKKALTRSSGIDRAGTRVMAQQQARASKERAAAEQSLRDKYAGVDIDAEIERLKPAMQSAYQDYQYGARNTWRQGKEKYEQLLSQVKELTRAKELLSKGVTEAANHADKVTMDVPLMIRLFEYAREDAQTDMDLHNVSERLIELSGEGRVLTMQDYDAIVGQTTEQMVSELGADGSALGSVAAAKSQQAALSARPGQVNPNDKAPVAPSAGAPVAKTTSPTTQPGEELTPDEQDALDKIKANAGLKSQYDRLLKQAQGGV